MKNNKLNILINQILKEVEKKETTTLRNGGYKNMKKQKPTNKPQKEIKSGNPDAELEAFYKKYGFDKKKEKELEEIFNTEETFPNLATEETEIINEVHNRVSRKLSRIYCVPKSILKEFKFDGKDNIKKLSEALGTKNYDTVKNHYNASIRLVKNSLGLNIQEAKCCKKQNEEKLDLTDNENWDEELNEEWGNNRNDFSAGRDDQDWENDTAHDFPLDEAEEIEQDFGGWNEEKLHEDELLMEDDTDNNPDVEMTIDQVINNPDNVKKLDDKKINVSLKDNN